MIYRPDRLTRQEMLDIFGKLAIHLPKKDWPAVNLMFKKYEDSVAKVMLALAMGTAIISDKLSARPAFIELLKAKLRKEVPDEAEDIIGRL